MEDARQTTGAGDPRHAPVELDPPFVNDAGAIQNLLLHECGSVALIRSKAGSVRSNHYHRTDWHYLYVFSGEMLYQARRVGGTSYPPAQRVRSGQMVFTPPMVEHRTTFPVDTVLISMARLPRDHATHEADLVRCSAE